MAQCTVLYPGLLGPDVPLQELARSEWPGSAALHGLLRLLRRGRVQGLQRESFEQRLLNCLGYVVPPGAELPVAQLRNQRERLSPRAGLWCLDPVFIQVDREMAYLADPKELVLSETEARAVIASLNTHFADDLHVYYYAPQQWLLELDLAVSTFTPTQAQQQDVNAVQATGQDATRWRKLMNEMQMLLHGHPVNTAREIEGKPLLNSVWLWGGGELQTRPVDIDLVYTDDALAQLAASVNGMEYARVPAELDKQSLGDKNSLIVLTSQLDAVRHKDVYAWLAALRDLEQRCITPLLAMLKQGRLSRIQLMSDCVQIELDRRALAKWWRRTGRVEHTILRLRDHHAC